MATKISKGRPLPRLRYWDIEQAANTVMLGTVLFLGTTGLDALANHWWGIRPFRFVIAILIFVLFLLAVLWYIYRGVRWLTRRFTDAPAP